MEAPEYFHGGYCRAGTPQFAPEKKAGSGGGEHFMVEELLDFSNEEEDEVELAVGADDTGFDAAAGNSTETSTVTAVDSCSNSFSGSDPHFAGDLVCRGFADASLSGDLCEPYEEIAELEWLSNFVEESFSSEDLQKLQLISGIQSSTSSENRAEISAHEGGGAAGRAAQAAFFRAEAPVPGKARSKRSRAAPSSWSSRLPELSPTTTASSAESQLIVPAGNFSGKKTVAKPAEKKEPSAGPAVADGRKCLHCATEKTPQWRTGPMGPKTLCNACGVRYKSGRLVPEYRPAASPTFVLSKHSNSHRKVLEIRRQKELQQQQVLQSGAAAIYDGGTAAAGDDFLIHHHLGPDFRQLI
ncbi:GATA transcription factor 12 [Cocos nucifera]|uniref:GATA transcription factor n=1 Tax=Cocos nucifera TaxID=13894 RepID=A0A8K0IAG3_COCNU|nr:GATA transcription factor 12 [Cocos nucifera]